MTQSQSPEKNTKKSAATVVGACVSVPADIKQVLEKAKGRDEWGEFLLSLYTEAAGFSSRRAFEELTSLLTMEDLESILKTSRVARQ